MLTCECHFSVVSYNFQNHHHTFCPLRHGIKALTFFTNPLTETLLQHFQIFMFILSSSDVFSILIKAKRINVATCNEKGHGKRQKMFHCCVLLSHLSDLSGNKALVNNAGKSWTVYRRMNMNGLKNHH